MSPAGAAEHGGESPVESVGNNGIGASPGLSHTPKIAAGVNAAEIMSAHRQQRRPHLTATNASASASAPYHPGMGRAQGQLRGAVAEHTDRFQALFGARRGSGGDRHREDLGLDLEPPQRLVFVRERLAAGDLKPGFAWRSEPAMCALPTSTMKTQYGLPAWFDTVRELARQVAVLELSEAQWVLGAAGVKATLLYGRAVGEVDRKEDVAETVMGLYNQLCTFWTALSNRSALSPHSRHR